MVPDGGCGGVVRAEDLADHGRQGRVLIAGRERVTRHPGPVSQVLPGSQGAWMLMARCALADSVSRSAEQVVIFTGRGLLAAGNGICGRGIGGGGAKRTIADGAGCCRRAREAGRGSGAVGG